MNRANKLLLIPHHFVEGIKYKLGGISFTPKPRFIQFPVSDRCDSCCIMCNRWRKKPDREIELEKIKEIFKTNLFSEIEEACLHGGEPTLRNDLADIFRVIQESCPKLRKMWLSTNGLNPNRVGTRAKEIITTLEMSRLDSLSFSISIDGMENTHEKIRGVRGGFRKALETVSILKDVKTKYPTYPIEIFISTVLQPLNINEIEDIEDLAKTLNIPVIFQPIMFDKFFHVEITPEIIFSKDELALFKQTIEKKLTRDLSPSSLYWENLLEMMEGKKRRIPCAFDRYVFSLYPTGEVLPCSREDWILYGNAYEANVDDIWFGKRANQVRKKMRREVCPGCSNYCVAEFSLKKEFFTYFLYYSKNIIKRLFNQEL
jgi:MoaA/NifB/PqqE/SkfB family radical SAM enzyme